MKIAFISYEYPPDTAFGGIATYTLQIAQLMQQRGHQIEVFAGSAHRRETSYDGDILVHRVPCHNRAEFAEVVAPVFAKRHQNVGFDVVESPEIGAESRQITALVPDIPLVVKLHTPTYLIQQVNYISPTWGMQMRRVVGALRRGQRPSLLSKPCYVPDTDPERIQTLKADLVTTPSHALGQTLIQSWRLDPGRIRVVPNPYLPSKALLDIPVATQTKRITFLGRLEVRKGILELAAAIPQILKRHPEAQFRFVGAPWPSPTPGLDMQQFLLKRLHPYRNQLEFTGAVPLASIPAILSETDICVFPSRWENFPGVCLEAMSAARGIVGSLAGGMVDMLEQGAVGRLVDPTHAKDIARAVSELLDNPGLRMELGEKARDRILSHYNQSTIGALQEHIYAEAIAQYHNRQGRKKDISAGAIANTAP